MAQCVVFQCLSCGHKETVAREEYEKTEVAQQPSLETMSGATIIYKPCPDSFECPKCKGDMLLNNCSVTTPLDSVIMVAPVYEDLAEVNEEERRLKEAQDHEATLNRMVEMIQPLIECNVKYLERMEGKRFLNDVFHTNPEDRPNIALVNSIVRFIGRATKWGCERAEELAVSVLEDVNMHTQAKAVKDLLKSMEKQGY